MARLYGRRWTKARAQHLTDNPLCRFCLLQGKTVEAKVVDHVTPHRGDPVLFWDPENWQSLCTPCHDSVKQAMEKGSDVGFFDVDGVFHPLGGGGQISEAQEAGTRDPAQKS